MTKGLVNCGMPVKLADYKITWEKLPDDFELPDDPVDNINQPAIAAALTESLELAGKLSDATLAMTNYGICATTNDNLAIKAPDWGYVAAISVPREEVIRSYTPQLQGETPAIVMEFLSDDDGRKYSIKPTDPPGEWFFYERILQVPNYAIFNPTTGALEVYRLDETKRYDLLEADSHDRFWIAEMKLFLGVWQGIRENCPGYWLRWWDEQGNLLLWGTEVVEQERQRVEQERQRAEQERQRAERLIAQLRAAGIEPEP
jgi:Uma2 family endonuclease